MTSPNLELKLADNLNCSRESAHNIIETFTNSILELIHDGENIEIDNLGKFELQKLFISNSHLSDNLQNFAKVKSIINKKMIYFTPDQQLKEVL